MKQLCDVLKTVLNKNIMEIAQEHKHLHDSWNIIVEESFTKKGFKFNSSAYNSYENNVYDLNMYKNLINARKAADHSSVKYVKNNILYIEADHQGWIQILQTKQNKILNIVKKKYPDLEISAIAFILENNAGQENIKKITEVTEKKEAAVEYSEKSVHQDVFLNIEDEALKNLLRELEKKIQKT